MAWCVVISRNTLALTEKRKKASLTLFAVWLWVGIKGGHPSAVGCMSV